VRPRSLVLTLLVLAGIGCASDRPADPAPGYVEEIESYRDQREQRLRAEDGWLSLIGLFWLEPGANAFGGDPRVPIPLPPDAAPPRAGALVLEGESVRLVPEPGVEIVIDGRPAGERILRDDGEGTPDILRLGRLQMYVIVRGGRRAVRVKDPQSEARREFHGLDFFPIDPAYRVEGRLVPYEQPEPRQIATVAGTTETMLAPGIVEFEIGGVRSILEPFVDEAGQRDLFIIFKDETSGAETYGAGRFLSAKLDGERVVLDFNKAYNPPCAFTPFATCPLPPPRNRLDVAIRAGERAYHHP